MLNSKLLFLSLISLLLSSSSFAGYNWQTSNRACIAKGQTYPAKIVWKDGFGDLADTHEKWLECCPGLINNGTACVDPSPRPHNPKECRSDSECSSGLGCYPSTYEAYFLYQDEEVEGPTELDKLEEMAEKDEKKYLQATDKPANYSLPPWIKQKDKNLLFCEKDMHCASYNCQINPYYRKERLTRPPVKPAPGSVPLQYYRVCMPKKICRPALYQEKPKVTVRGEVKCAPGFGKNKEGVCIDEESLQAMTAPYKPNINFQFDKEGCAIKVNPTEFMTSMVTVRSFEWLIAASTSEDCNVKSISDGKGSFLNILKTDFVKPLVDGRKEAYDELKKAWTDIHEKKKKLISKKLEHNKLVGELSEHQKNKEDYELELMAADRVLGMEMYELMMAEQSAILDYETRLKTSLMTAHMGLYAAQQLWKGVGGKQPGNCKRVGTGWWGRTFKTKFHKRWKRRYKVWGPKEINSKSYDSYSHPFQDRVGIKLGKRKKTFGIKGKTKYVLHDPLLPVDHNFKHYGGKGGSGKFRRRMYNRKVRGLTEMRKDMDKRLRRIFASSANVGDFELGLNKGCVTDGVYSPNFFDKLKFELDPRNQTEEEKHLVSKFCETNPNDVTCQYKQKKKSCEESQELFKKIIGTAWIQNVLYSHSHNNQQSIGDGSARYIMMNHILADLQTAIDYLGKLVGDRTKNMVDMGLRASSIKCISDKYITPALEYGNDKLNKGMTVGANKYENRDRERKWQRSKQAVLHCNNCNLSVRGGKVEFDLKDANRVAKSDARWRKYVEREELSSYNTLYSTFTKDKSAFNSEMRAMSDFTRKKFGKYRYEELVAERNLAHQNHVAYINTPASQSNQGASGEAGQAGEASGQGEAKAAALAEDKKDKEEDKKVADKGKKKSSPIRRGATYVAAKRDGDDIQKAMWGELYEDDPIDNTSYSTHTGLDKANIKETLKDIDQKERKKLLVSESGDTLWEIVTKTYFRSGYKRVLIGPMYKDIKKKKEGYIDIGDRALKNDKSGVLNLKQNNIK